jgi:hypothetical protein
VGHLSGFGFDYGVDHGDDGHGWRRVRVQLQLQLQPRLPTHACGYQDLAATQQLAPQAEASSCSNLAIWALDCGRLTHAPAGAGEDTQPSRKWASLQIRGSTREPIHATPADGR